MRFVRVYFQLSELLKLEFLNKFLSIATLWLDSEALAKLDKTLGLKFADEMVFNCTSIGVSDFSI